jgi:effector-binding domain-containing protein
MMYPIETRELDEVDTAVEMATLSVAEIGPFVGRAYRDVASYLDRKGAGPAGMPFARYHRVSDEQFEVEAGFPASTPVSGEGDIEPSDLPAGPAAVTLYVGPYDEMAPAYDALTTWIVEHGGEPHGDPWEIYFDDPATQPDPAQWRTEIVMPYRIP